MAIEVPASAAFYMRGSLNRALQQQRDLIEDCRKVLADDNSPALARSMAQGNVNYWIQWYKEAVKEFRQLPEAIRPDADLLDYEPRKS